MPRSPLIFLTMLAFCGAAPGAGDAQGWITHPEASATPVVLHFRRELDLDDLPETLRITVTADNRFVLYVNGKPVARGPSTGTLERWRTSALDLAPHLAKGRNVVAAVVWNFGDIAPAHQQSVATGLRVTGDPIATSQPGWRVRRDAGHGASDGKKQIPWTYYVASTPEVIDAADATWDRDDPEISAAGWVDAVPAPAAVRPLIDDPLPPQTFAPAEPGVVVRSSSPGLGAFPAVPITIPAHTVAKLLIRRDAMISAYPELDVDGGRGARIEMQYGEALYDSANLKADRDLVGDRKLRGFHDTFIADGQPRTFAPLWWRTFRFVEIAVTTRSRPLTLRALRVHETGYPFEQVGSFRSSDAELDRIWDIGWRTLRVDAHETFMDSSYWEQLQYTGDTRLQMLISYAVSGDSRLARQAIDAFAESDVDGGVQQGAYPSRLNNIIATFSFAWIGMLADWSQEQPDRELPARHLPRMRRVLAYFEPFLNGRGLVGKNPHWNFIDWSGQRWDDRDSFPSWGQDNGSCLMTALWLGALRQGAALEADLGDRARAAEYTASAEKARTAIRANCWDESRGLFADDAVKQVFSQHMNVFAVLYDIATREEAHAILDRIVKPGAGIDAPEGMYAPTYYFAWYLVRAFEHAGHGERYFDLLRTWRDLLAFNYTTWPESRGETRSDTHAWSAHPTADLLGLVAGIRPGATGYARVRIAPNLGSLEWLEATAATPRGPVRVRYRVANGMLNADIDRPAALPGEFHWRGKVYPLSQPRTFFTLPAY